MKTCIEKAIQHYSSWKLLDDGGELTIKVFLLYFKGKSSMMVFLGLMYHAFNSNIVMLVLSKTLSRKCTPQSLFGVAKKINGI